MALRLSNQSVYATVMAKLTLVDKLHIQTLREQGLGAKAIRAAYPDKKMVFEHAEQNLQASRQYRVCYGEKERQRQRQAEDCENRAKC